MTRFVVSNERVREMKKETSVPVPPEKISRWFASAHTSLVAAFVSSILFSPFSVATVVPYTKAMFVAGLNKGGFVLITLINHEDGSQRQVCALEAGLLGAIHLQQNIDYDERGRQRAEQIALRHWNQPFSFTNSEAFNAVKASYTASQLAEVRERLSKYDKSALSKQLDDPSSPVHEMYSHPYRESYRDAVAHVLLENGILVGVDDRTPALILLSAES